jgi:dynactin-6
MAASPAAAPPTPAATSAAAALPSYPFLIQSTGCVVCCEAILTGPNLIKLGAGCIIHPRARIDSSRGPISIGACNVLEEGSMLRSTGEQGLTVGDNNILRAGCCVEADVGSANVIGQRAHLTQAGSLGDGCSIGPMLVIQWPIANATVLYGGARALHATQRYRADLKAANIDDISAKESLREMLSKTHRLIH